MKFIFVSSSFNIGGVATSFSYLVDGAIDEKDEVEFHIVDQIADIQAHVPDRVKIKNIHCNYNDIYGKGTINSIAFLYRKYGLWPVIKKIYDRILRTFGIYKPFALNKEFFDYDIKSQCDVCVVLKENDLCLFYAINNIKARKRIAFFHTAGYLRDEYKPIYCSKTIDEIITVSQGNRNFLVEKMPQIASKIHVIHNIVPVDRIKKLAKGTEKLFAPNELPILYVGRICKEKGVNQIIDAAVILKDEIPDIHWYLLGRFDHELSPRHFDKLLTEQKIKDRVTVLSASINPYPYIAQAWAIINPSQRESFGMVIREAQILGKPVIATKTYGSVELIEDNETGILVDVDDAYQMAEAIKRIYYDTNLYNKMVANLKNADFDESKLVAEQFNALLK